MCDSHCYPCWGPFTLTYNSVSIRIPGFLNNVARYKPNSFWIWLTTVKYPMQSYISMEYEHIGEEERYQNDKKEIK